MKKKFKGKKTWSFICGWGLGSEEWGVFRCRQTGEVKRMRVVVK